MLAPDFSRFPEIRTDRLLLRKMTRHDAPAILRLRSDERVMQYIDKERAHTISDALVFIDRILLSLQNNDGITWAMALPDAPETLIGTIGFWRLVKEHFRAEVGYMLSPDHWKSGFTKEALVTLLEFGFNKLQFHSVEAHISPNNDASAALLKSTGFVKEAHFKENHFFNGVFKDTAVYSRFRHP